MKCNECGRDNYGEDQLRHWSECNQPARQERRRYALLQAAATLVAAPQQEDSGGNFVSYSIFAAVNTASGILAEIEKREKA